MTQGNPQTPAQVTCPAARDPSVRKFAVAGLLIAFGIWCLRDGYFVTKKDEGVDELNKKAFLMFNRSAGIALPPIGLVFLVWGLRDMRRVLVTDDDGIGYVGKKRIAWSEVTALDATDAAKGLIRLNYRQDGQEKTLVLDRLRLRNFRELAQLLENRLPVANT